MLINIAAHAGEGKTKTVLSIVASLDLVNNKKVVFISSDRNVNDWIPDVVNLVGEEKAGYFRPVYAKNLENVISILPYIDHLPYDTVVLDGFSSELHALSQDELKKLLTFISNLTTDHQGKIFTTYQLNSFLKV